VRGAATIGVFLVPWFLATAAAQLLRRLVQHAWLHAFSRGAGPAVVALLVVGARGVTRATYTGPLYGFIALAALALGLWRKIHPFAILAGGALVGATSALFAGGDGPLSSSSLIAGAALLQEIASVRDVSWGLEPVESV